MDAKKLLKKTWHFIWEDNSLLSWLVNIVLAFLLIYFIIYPGLGFLFSTSHPVVAVVSESMEHDNGFNEWWKENREWYVQNGINKEDFERFPLKNGFNKGDIMVLIGKNPEDIEIGDVIVFISDKKDPIIHRVVSKIENGDTIFQTKGDNNEKQIRNAQLDETNVSEDRIIGKAVFRVPLLGYIKIIFTEAIGKHYCSLTNNFFPCR